MEGSSTEVTLRGVLKGHAGWVTSIATSPESSNVLISGSRDKSIIIWDLTKEDAANYGVPRRALKGHSHFVSDVVISSDGQFVLSGSWDGTLRLWDIKAGICHRRFVGHKKDVLSVAFSADNRQIVSGSRDKTIKLWNTLGLCKYTIEENGHTEWVSCVRFTPLVNNESSEEEAKPPMFVSAGWDKNVKVWNLQNCRLVTDLKGHQGYVNTVTVSPDGTLCASGGKDGVAMLWNLEEGEYLCSLDAGDIINALVFSPCRYWLCAGTRSSIRIWDLDSKSVVAELNKTAPDFFLNQPSGLTEKPECISLAWSSDGKTLFAGYTDNMIRVWGV